MRILDSKTLPNGDTEYDIEISDEEREMIKELKGWDKITPERLNEWFLETVETTIKNNEKTN